MAANPRNRQRKRLVKPSRKISMRMKAEEQYDDNQKEDNASRHQQKDRYPGHFESRQVRNPGNHNRSLTLPRRKLALVSANRHNRTRTLKRRTEYRRIVSIARIRNRVETTPRHRGREIERGSRNSISPISDLDHQRNLSTRRNRGRFRRDCDGQQGKRVHGNTRLVRRTKISCQTRSDLDSYDYSGSYLTGRWRCKVHLIDPDASWHGLGEHPAYWRWSCESQVGSRLWGCAVPHGYRQCRILARLEDCRARSYRVE